MEDGGSLLKPSTKSPHPRRPFHLPHCLTCSQPIQLRYSLPCKTYTCFLLTAYKLLFLLHWKIRNKTVFMLWYELRVTAISRAHNIVKMFTPKSQKWCKFRAIPAETARNKRMDPWLLNGPNMKVSGPPRSINSILGALKNCKGKEQGTGESKPPDRIRIWNFSKNK